MESVPNSETLLAAVVEGDTLLVHTILTSGYTVSDADWTDYFLLLIALEHKDKDMADLLLDMGCRVNRVPKYNYSHTPLYYAIELNNIELVKKMLSKGACIDDRKEGEESPFCLALTRGQYNIIEWMLVLYNFENINPASEDTALHFLVACEKNKQNMMKQFVAHGVSVNSKTNTSLISFSGYTPLHFAVRNISLEMVEFLLENGANVSIENSDGCTPLHLAIQKTTFSLTAKQREDLERIIDALLWSHSNSYDPIDDSCRKLPHFLVACTRNNSYSVTRFLQQGADVRQRVPPGLSEYSGFTALHFAVVYDRINVVEVLLSQGADVGARTEFGWTPLGLAVAYSQIKIVELLLSRGADVNETYDQSCFPFSIGSGTQFIGKLVTHCLLQHGTGPRASGPSELTPLHLACTRNYALLYELAVGPGSWPTEPAGAAKSWAQSSDGAVEIVSLLLSYGAEPNARDSGRASPLHYACGGGQALELVGWCTGSEWTGPALMEELFAKQAEIIELLAARGADVDARQIDGRSALHNALLLLEGDVYGQALSCLLKTYCDVNAQDCLGVTPLHLACLKRNLIVVRELLYHGADVNAKDAATKTALDYLPLDDGCDYYLFDAFQNHLIRLCVLGLYISDAVKASFRCIRRHYKRKFTFIDDQAYAKFAGECKRELEKMKAVWLDADTTLHAILAKNADEMAKYAENDVLKQILTSKNFRVDFPNFGYLLELQFNRSLQQTYLRILGQSQCEEIDSICGTC